MPTFNTNFEIYFEDISPSGIVHLEKIAEWMSMGRERFFKSTCPEYLKFSESEVNMFTVSMTVLDVTVAKWADEIEARISFFKIKRISFEIHFDFYNKRKKENTARCIQKVAFSSKSKPDSFAPVPRDINSGIRNFLMI